LILGGIHLENSIQSRVIRVVREFASIEGEEDVLNANIGTDIALTSLDKMTLFIALEDEFDRSIPQEDVEEVETVKEIVEFIEAKRLDIAT
jgi:acyl carrier protein